MERRAAYGPSLDLQPGGPAPAAAQLAALVHASGEFCVALRGGRAFGLRLAAAAPPAPRAPPALAGHVAAMFAGGTKARPRAGCACKEHHAAWMRQGQRRGLHAGASQCGTDRPSVPASQPCLRELF